jgi:hypothetical protein
VMESNNTDHVSHSYVIMSSLQAYRHLALLDWHALPKRFSNED